MDESEMIRGDVAAVMLVQVLILEGLDALGADKAAMAELILDMANKMPEVEQESPHSMRATLLKFHSLLTGAKPLDTLFH